MGSRISCVPLIRTGSILRTLGKSTQDLQSCKRSWIADKVGVKLGRVMRFHMSYENIQEATFARRSSAQRAGLFAGEVPDYGLPLGYEISIN